MPHMSGVKQPLNYQYNLSEDCPNQPNYLKNIFRLHSFIVSYPSLLFPIPPSLSLSLFLSLPLFSLSLSLSLSPSLPSLPPPSALALCPTVLPLVYHGPATRWRLTPLSISYNMSDAAGAFMGWGGSNRPVCCCELQGGGGAESAAGGPQGGRQGSGG